MEIMLEETCDFPVLLKWWGFSRDAPTEFVQSFIISSTSLPAKPAKQSTGDHNEVRSGVWGYVMSLMDVRDTIEELIMF